MVPWFYFALLHVGLHRFSRQNHEEALVFPLGSRWWMDRNTWCQSVPVPGCILVRLGPEFDRESNDPAHTNSQTSLLIELEYIDVSHGIRLPKNYSTGVGGRQKHLELPSCLAL